VPTLIRYADLEVGQALPRRTFSLGRADLVRYAGASGDFNPIHWNERYARGVGLPDVIAHGMLTMALAGRLVTDWLGDPGAVVEYGVRFTRPVVVPDARAGNPEQPTAELVVEGVVAEKLPDGVVRIDLTARAGEDGEKVLGMARMTVRLDRR
jgi:acyl dehydratase